MNKRTFLKPSLLVILLVTVFSFSTWKQWVNWKLWKTNQFVSDVTYYYSYLPAAFIHHDLKFNYPNQYGLLQGDGFVLPKYTCGMAILYSPFFFIGQAVAENPDDEFGEAYATAIHLGSIFYFIIGLIFLRKTLVRFFSETISSVLLITAIFGTNLFYYVFTEGEMSHGYLFCLVSVFLWLTIRWHEKTKAGAALLQISLLMGFVFGLIVLIRPSDGVFFLVFLLYDVRSVTTFKEKVRFWINRWKELLIIILMCFLVFLPQLLFWKHVTGSFLYFSYQNEGFFFSDPKIVEVLLSYRKGLLIYTPVMALSLVGFFFLRKQAPQFSIALPVFFLFNLYIISSWWCWWYGGSYGMRAMIESYPLLLLTIGSLLSHIFKNRWQNAVKKYTLSLLIAGCIYLNMLQTIQYKNSILNSDSMNKNAYWHIFGKLRFDSLEHEVIFYKLLTRIDYDAAQKGTNREDY